MFATTTITRRTLALAAGLALGLSSVAAMTATTADARVSAPAKRVCSFAIAPGGDAIDLPLPNGGKVRIADADGDGIPETMLFDFDGDGKWDAGVNDCDGDGRFDFRWIDRNRDGKVQPGEVERIRPRTRAEHICTKAVHAQGRNCRRKPQNILAVRRLPQRPALSLQPPKPVAVLQPVGSPTTSKPVEPPQKPAEPQNMPTRLNVEVDANGDGKDDPVVGDTRIAVGQSVLKRTADGYEVVLGLAGGATVAGVHNVDNDAKDQEIVVEDPNLTPNQSYGIDLDGDGDHDVIVVGTKGGAKVTGKANVDNDPNDDEIVVEDPNLTPNQSYGIDLDGDGDHDVIVVGTKR